MSELEDNQRNFFRMQKIARTKKVARNTRNCQKVAEQQQQQHKLYLHDYNNVVTVLQKL